MKRTHLSLVSALNGHPFAITAEGLEMILAIASRSEITPELLRAYRQGQDEDPARSFMVAGGQKVQGSRRLYLREGGVGVLPIRGPMVRHGDIFDEISGASSMASLANDIGLAVESKEVQSIVFDGESPGGEMPGDLIDVIRRAADAKPTVMYIGNWGMSALYWAATAASDIVLHRSAHTGSVGVRAVFLDTSRMEDALGVDRYEMMASQSPHKISNPRDAEGKARIQAILDQCADDFIADVAKGRNVSRKKVLESFGKGDAVQARVAVERGMADDLATLEDVIARVSGGRRYRSPSRAGTASSGASPMARKTWGEVILSALGARAHEPAPDDADAEAIDPAIPTPAATTSDGDDSETLRKRLADSESARKAAETRAAAEADARRRAELNATVKEWVRTGRIEPFRAAVTGSHLRSLSPEAAASFIAWVESKPATSLTDEVVANQALPPGGKVQMAPSAPDTGTDGDDGEAERRELVAYARKIQGLAPSNGTH